MPEIKLTRINRDLAEIEMQHGLAMQASFRTAPARQPAATPIHRSDQGNQ